jgi:flagellar L-ring protein precursor FlgH
MKNKILMLGLSGLLLTVTLDAEVYVGPEQLISTKKVAEKVYKVGDFVHVKISETSIRKNQGTTAGGKETEFALKIANWIRFKTKRDAGGGHVKNLMPAALNEPEIEFESDNRFQNNQSDEYKSSLVEDITARIAEVMPNGNFYIEGHKEVRDNGNIRMVSFSGEVSLADVKKGGNVPSDRIFNLKIEINEEGERRDSTRLNLLQKFLLWIWPF